MPPKTLFTPVFYPPNPSLSSISSSPPETAVANPQAYLDYLSRTHVALSQVGREFDEDEESDLGDGGSQGRITSLREQVIQAFEEARGNPCSGRWTKLTQLLRLNCTSGGGRWLTTNSPSQSDEQKTGNGKTTSDLTGKWLLASSEEEWARWERMREREVSGVEKVKGWLTPKPMKETTAKPRPVKEKAREKQDALPFGVVQRTASNATAKPNPKAKPEAKKDDGQDLPNAIPKHIQDVPEDDFLPPSFPSKLSTSTPNDNRRRPAAIPHAPGPENLIPIESESPLFGHARDLSIPISVTPLQEDQCEENSPEKILFAKANRKRSLEEMPETPRPLKQAKVGLDSPVMDPATSSNADVVMRTPERDGEKLPTLMELLASERKSKSPKRKRVVTTPAAASAAAPEMGREQTPTPVTRHANASVQVTNSLHSPLAVQPELEADDVDMASLSEPAIEPAIDPLYSALPDFVPKDAPNPGGYPIPGGKADLELDDFHMGLGMEGIEVEAQSFSSIAHSSDSSSEEEEEEEIPDFTAHPSFFNPPITSTQPPPIPNISPLKGLRRLSSIAQTQAETRSPSKRGAVPGSLGAFGYSSQLDVEGNVSEVERFLEGDLDIISEQESEPREQDD